MRNKLLAFLVVCLLQTSIWAETTTLNSDLFFRAYMPGYITTGDVTFFVASSVPTSGKDTWILSDKVTSSNTQFQLFTWSLTGYVGSVQLEFSVDGPLTQGNTTLPFTILLKLDPTKITIHRSGNLYSLSTPSSNGYFYHLDSIAYTTETVDTKFYDYISKKNSTILDISGNNFQASLDSSDSKNNTLSYTLYYHTSGGKLTQYPTSLNNDNQSVWIERTGAGYITVDRGTGSIPEGDYTANLTFTVKTT
jgi:hypothetical protein